MKLGLLEEVRDKGLTGMGEFYHEALKFMLVRGSDITTSSEREMADRSAVIMCQGIGAEKYSAAALDLWRTVEFFDVARNNNEGLAMMYALIALGQIDAKSFLPQIVLRLDSFNTQPLPNSEVRRRVQRGVEGCIRALGMLKDISGFRPVFFVSIDNKYETGIRELASNTLPNIVDDPGPVITAIIRDPGNDASVKYEAWKEMLKSRAPGSSKAKVAADALAVGWNYSTQDPRLQTNLREMRKSAIDTIRQFGAADNSVYENLRKSYVNNYRNTDPDREEIELAVRALVAIKTDESVNILYDFLQDLHMLKTRGAWGRGNSKENFCFTLIISTIGNTGTQSEQVKHLLERIRDSREYTSAEQRRARDALRALGYR
jgi:hypothetical protein